MRYQVGVNYRCPQVAIALLVESGHFSTSGYRTDAAPQIPREADRRSRHCLPPYRASF